MKLNTKPLADIEAGFPIYAEGPYFVEIVNVELKPNKAGTGNNLNFKLRVLNPVLTRHETGETVDNHGKIYFFTQFSMVPTDKWDPDVKVKEVAEAVRLPEDEDVTIESLIGKQCKAIVRYRAEEGPYPASNEVTRLVAIGDDEIVPM